MNCVVRPLAAPAAGISAISISPAQLEIPALESRFVLLTFAPAAMRAHAAMLDFSVAGSGATSGFQCEVHRRLSCLQYGAHFKLLRATLPSQA